ncbi:MAG: hypothetical protein IJ733_11220 [Lachnospiraceae bacterium]|nr:hypothetical protein [Lachnospiraceae bacterium]
MREGLAILGNKETDYERACKMDRLINTVFDSYAYSPNLSDAILLIIWSYEFAVLVTSLFSHNKAKLSNIIKILANDQYSNLALFARQLHSNRNDFTHLPFRLLSHEDIDSNSSEEMIIHAKNIKVCTDTITTDCEVDDGTKFSMVFGNPGLKILECITEVEEIYQTGYCVDFPC